MCCSPALMPVRKITSVVHTHTHTHTVTHRLSIVLTSAGRGAGGLLSMSIGTALGLSPEALPSR